MNLRIGLIGGGIMGRQHAEYLAKHPDTDLVAIADPFNDTLSGDLGIEHFADYRQMLGTAQLDGVIIANPNDQHVETALDCIHARVPMLLEKPVGTSVLQVSRLIEAEAKSGVPVLVGHHRRHNPIIQQAKAIIESGALGTVTMFTALWQSQKSDSYFDVEWRRKKGAGVMLINLVHDFDLMRYLCGEVACVQAITSNSARQLEVEDSAAVLIRFASGALGSLTGSDACATPWSWEQSAAENPAFAQQPEQPCYMIGGTRGSMTVPQLRTWQYGADKGWNNPLIEARSTVPPGTALGNQLEHFVQVIHKQAQPLITVADAARTLALVEAAGIAAAERRLVELNSSGFVEA